MTRSILPFSALECIGVKAMSSLETVLCILQVFPPDTPGGYLNRVELLGGAASAQLSAEYRQVRADRLDLVFGDTVFQVGPFQLTRVRSVTPVTALLTARVRVFCIFLADLRPCASHL